MIRCLLPALAALLLVLWFGAAGTLVASVCVDAETCAVDGGR